MMRICFLVLLSTLAVCRAAAQADVVDTALPLDSIRVMYVEAIYERIPVDAVLDHLEEGTAPTAMGPDMRAAYRGAATVLRARDAVWPGSKLKYTRRGLAVLDRAVTLHPEHVELRFLRLVSCYRLPKILGRSWSVAEDMEIVAERYTSLHGRVPASLYNEVESLVHDAISDNPGNE